MIRRFGPCLIAPSRVPDPDWTLPYPRPGGRPPARPALGRTGHRQVRRAMPLW